MRDDGRSHGGAADGVTPRRPGDDRPGQVPCARVVVAAQRPIRAVRYGVLIATGLVVLAAIKPWGATPPPAAREPLQPAPVAISPASAVPRPVESPVSSICHDSSSWRVATEGSFVHPAPYAEQMYHQEVRGRGEGLRVVVQGEHER